MLRSMKVSQDGECIRSRCAYHRHRIDKYLDTLLAMKSEATAIFAPQDGRWKITVSFDGRRFCVPNSLLRALCGCMSRFPAARDRLI